MSLYNNFAGSLGEGDGSATRFDKRLLRVRLAAFQFAFSVSPHERRAAQLLLETTTYPNMKTRLEAAAAPGATFRHTARELLALSAWRANDAVATRQWLDLIANDGETPPSLRSRAEALQALLPPVAKS